MANKANLDRFCQRIMYVYIYIYIIYAYLAYMHIDKICTVQMYANTLYMCACIDKCVYMYGIYMDAKYYIELFI